MIRSSDLLAGVPDSLRASLLTTYREIASNYLEQRWEPATLNGEKFCEVVYSIINGAVKGTFPASANKPNNMANACRQLENEPADSNRVGDRSLRVLIPRILPVLYEIRNNRGVGHIGGDVDPNHMDAEAVQSMASWVMAELVRVFHHISISEAQQAVDALVERRTPFIWDVNGVKRVLNPKMSAKNQVLTLLHHSHGWVTAGQLVEWTEYSNASVFRKSVLRPLHKMRLIEYDSTRQRARISPTGRKEAEIQLARSTRAG